MRCIVALVSEFNNLPGVIRRRKIIAFTCPTGSQKRIYEKTLWIRGTLHWLLGEFQKTTSRAVYSVLLYELGGEMFKLCSLSRFTSFVTDE